MRNRLLEDIGNGLAKQPFKWVWWWRLRWGDFITVDPPLTVGNPLWCREQSSLKNVLLFGLSSDELQKEITRYWQQPFWKRWLLSLFTSIQSKIKLWSYYQRCLSFREVCLENLFDAKEPIAFVFEQYLGREVIHWFNRSRIQFENYLEKRAGNLKWIQNHECLIDRFFRKNWRFFSKLVKKKLTQLTMESNINSLQSQLEKEYFRLEDILHCYLSTWRKNIFNLPTSSTELTNSDIFVDASTGKEVSCSMHSIEDWVKMKRQVIASLLQEQSSEPFLRIKNLLESCLYTFRLLIDHKIDNYEKLICDVRWRRINADKAIQQAGILQSELNRFFRKSALLFHPDKSFGNEVLSKIQSGLFKQFQQLSEESLEKIKKGLQTLQNCLPKKRNSAAFWKMEQDLRLRINKLEQEIDAMHARTEAGIEKLKVDLKAQGQQFKAEIEDQEQQFKAEVEAKHQQVRKEIAELGSKIEDFINSPEFLKFINKQCMVNRYAHFNSDYLKKAADHLVTDTNLLHGACISNVGDN